MNPWALQHYYLHWFSQILCTLKNLPVIFHWLFHRVLQFKRFPPDPPIVLAVRFIPELRKICFDIFPRIHAIIPTPIFSFIPGVFLRILLEIHQRLLSEISQNLLQALFDGNFSKNSLIISTRDSTLSSSRNSSKHFSKLQLQN